MSTIHTVAVAQMRAEPKTSGRNRSKTPSGVRASRDMVILSARVMRLSMGFDNDPVKLYFIQDTMNRPLTRSIIATVISFLLLQAVLFSVLARVNGIGIAANWAFFPVSLGFHALILLFLLCLRADFFIESSG